MARVQRDVTIVLDTDVEGGDVRVLLRAGTFGPSRDPEGLVVERDTGIRAPNIRHAVTVLADKLGRI